jgi:Xaa-Pro aminopeptidase
MGQPSPEQRELSNAFVAACNLLLESLKPGTTYGRVAAKVDSFLDDIGYRQFALPGYGHGIGILGNEWYPVVVDSEVPYESKGNLVLEPNMIEVAAVLLNKPGVGGMRMETPVLLTEGGNEPLNKVPVEPAIIEV